MWRALLFETLVRASHSILLHKRLNRLGAWGRCLVFVVLAAGGLAAGCQDKFDEARTLGGVTVSADVLNRGHGIYRQHCATCHGARGDGRGPSAESMTPPPRSFRLGYFKYASTPKSELPTDADLRRTIRQGLKGTHMPAWSSLSDEDANAVIQYIKTFSNRWEKERTGRPIALGNDPWSDTTAASRAGRTIYHGKAGCWTCHPSYAPRAEILRARAETMIPREARDVPWRDELLRSEPTKTLHGVLSPPDFLADPLRSGESTADIARTVAAGIGGTPMPSFHEQLSPREVWAVAHYVYALEAARGTPRADHLRSLAHASAATSDP